jgi:hypothetical protein
MGGEKKGSEHNLGGKQNKRRYSIIKGNLLYTVNALMGYYKVNFLYRDSSRSRLGF